MTSGQKAYRKFLKTDFWLELTALKKSIVGKCERCDSTDELQSHHVKYPKNWLETTLDDLEVLCRTCHRTEHGLSVLYVPTTKEYEVFCKVQLVHDISMNMFRNMRLKESHRRALKRVLELHGDNPGIAFRVANVFKFEKDIAEENQRRLLSKSS